jgi:hypothetical protein
MGKFDTEMYISVDTPFIGSIYIPSMSRVPNSDIRLLNDKTGFELYQYSNNTKDSLILNDKNLTGIIYQEVTDFVLPYNKTIGNVINNTLVETIDTIDTIDFTEYNEIDNNTLIDNLPVLLLFDNFVDLTYSETAENSKIVYITGNPPYNVPVLETTIALSPEYVTPAPSA